MSVFDVAEDAATALLLKASGVLPDPLDQAAYAVGLVAVETAVDAAYEVTQLVLLPWRVLGVIR